jgi:hypothetical protein
MFLIGGLDWVPAFAGMTIEGNGYDRYEYEE